MGDNNDDVDDEVTLQEALDAQQMLEEQSAAVLGASDPQNCSYLKVCLANVIDLHLNFIINDYLFIIQKLFSSSYGMFVMLSCTGFILLNTSCKIYCYSKYKKQKCI